MTQTRTDPAGAIPSTEPSTRRVTSGSPAPDPSRPAGEPFSSSGEDDIFADLKAKIGQLWDAKASADDIRSLLIDPGKSD